MFLNLLASNRESGGTCLRAIIAALFADCAEETKAEKERAATAINCLII